MFSVRSIILTGAVCALRARRGAALAALLWLAGAGSAPAAHSPPDVCASATSCTLTLTKSNVSSIGTGNFGTVNLSLNLQTNAATIDVKLVDGLVIIKTGFLGAFGFGDHLGGGLTIGDFKSNGADASPLYSAFTSIAPSSTKKDLHFDGFGYTNNAAATTGPNPQQGLNQISFTVFKNTLSDVHQLLRQFSPEGGQGPAYFVVDFWGRGVTGLLAATSVPEPGSLAMLASALIALGILRRRKVI